MSMTGRVAAIVWKDLLIEVRTKASFHSMLFFAFGLTVGVMLTPLRRHLRTPWPFVGGGVALLIFMPNIVWQIQNGWPTASFVRDLNENVMAGISRIQFVLGQNFFLAGDFPHCLAGLKGLFGEFGGFVVADDRRQRGGQRAP